MSVEIKIKIDNADEIISFLKSRPTEMRKEMNKAIKKTVFKVEREAKHRSPVDSGRMRASIEAKEYESVGEGEVAVGVRYAIFVHEGTRYMTERPFLADAVAAAQASIQGFFEQAVSNVLKK